MAGAARRVSTEGNTSESESVEESRNETGDGTGMEPSVAAGWRGSRGAVLERDQGRGTADARGIRAGTNKERTTNNKGGVLS